MTLRHVLSVFVLAWFTISGSAAQSAGSLQDDFELFLSLWGGEYDNLAQAEAQKAAKRPAGDRNISTRILIRKVDLPAFGPHAYYAEWQDTEDAARLLRQRIYGFEIDEARQKIRLNLHIWPAESPGFVERTRGAHLDPSKLDGLTPADMLSFLGRECDVFFERNNDVFVGEMDKGACAFAAPDEKETPIYSWSRMTLSSTQFNYLDGWYNRDNTPYRRFTKDWYIYDRKD